MHREVLTFVQETANSCNDFFSNSRVLEIGSRSVKNQPSIRSIFKNCDYTGVDISNGPNVDIVSEGHKFKSNQLFDVAISCECFEHDPFWVLTVQNMINHLKWNGMLIFTCASTNRPEHGTKKTSPESSIKGIHPEGFDLSNFENYYQNLTEHDFKSKIPAFTDGTLVGGYWVSNEGCHDLYYRGWKR
jgi:SAM-dependent methyltransferase